MKDKYVSSETSYLIIIVIIIIILIIIIINISKKKKKTLFVEGRQRCKNYEKEKKIT